MTNIVRNAAYYTIGNFTSKAINFLLLPLYTKYLSPDEYGIVNSVQVFSSILLIFLTLGLERAIYRLYFDYVTDEERKIFLGTVSIGISITSFIVCVTLFFFNKPIGNIYKSISFYPYFSYAILTAYFMTFELVPKISLQVKEQANKYLLISLIVLLMRLIPVIWQVVFLKAGAIGMLKGAMLGNVVSLIVLIPVTIRQITIKFSYSIFRNALMYCLPFIPMLVSSWVVNMSDRIFIERYFSTYEVGIYSLGYKIGQLVQLLSTSILMAYNPFFYKHANSEDQINAKKKLYKANNISILFLLTVGFWVAFFSKDIIVIFFDRRYLASYKIIPIITIGYFFVQLISLQNLSFYQNKKMIVIMNINIVAAIINIGLNYAFISKYGLYGASVATALTQYVFFIIIYIYSQKYYFIPYNWKIILPLSLLFIIFIILSLIYFPVNPLSVFVKIFFVICITIYVFRYKIHLLSYI